MNLDAQKDKDIESDSPGGSLDPLESHTLSLKNNAAGLSLDEHEKPLNGTQLNPFVYGSVPTVPHAVNSLPSGALVNGPGSHPTSEVHCVLNKGNVLSNSVLDAAWQAEKDTSPGGVTTTQWASIRRLEVRSRSRRRNTSHSVHLSTRHRLTRKRKSVNWPVPHSRVTVRPKCTLADLPRNRQCKQDLRGTQAGQEALQVSMMMQK